LTKVTNRRGASALGVIRGALVLVLAAGALALTAHAQADVTATKDTTTGRRAAMMRDAAREFAVPESVLLAVSYHESRWENHHGQPSAAGGYGLMHLTAAAAIYDGRGKDGDGPRVLDGPSQRTLQRASQLLGVAPGLLRRDDQCNARGGAALLAQYARELRHGRLPTSPGEWYGAVARYSGATDLAGARLFADDVFATIRDGASLTTTDGQYMQLPPTPSVRPRRDQLALLHLTGAGATAAAVTTPECPTGLACTFVPAAYAQNDPSDPTNYGNYDHASRPADMRIQYIIIHDTEGSYTSTINLFKNSNAFVSAHYVIRSSDGAITQMVPTADVAWHAGNWWVNMHSIGIEHEGVAIDGASWYTEAMYRSSAALVRYLAARYQVPLDREHILGHDNVVGPTPDKVSSMHWDPGPFWDWAHYMQLLQAPPTTLLASSSLITINPVFASNVQVVTDCSSGTCVQVPAQPTNFVYLRTQPSSTAPLLSDPALHPSGAPGTTQASDWSDKAVTGQRFVQAGHSGDWLGIWFAGKVGWFHIPVAPTSPAATGGGGRTAPPIQPCGQVVTPRAGLTSIPVYGRAYPETSAYQGTSIEVQTIDRLQYTIPAGQRYYATSPVTTDYYAALKFNSVNTLMVGHDQYVQISLNHRMAFLRAADIAFGFIC
jgi:N-acetylmuramoyl-L-alanine amidase